MRFILICLAACEPVKSPSTDTGGLAETSEGEGETGDTAPPDETAAEETADTSDTSEPACSGVEVVGVVAYELGTEIYGLAVVDDIVYVARPIDGDRSAGVVDGWGIAQFEAGLLEESSDAPDVEVRGDGPEQYLTFGLFEDEAMGRVCGPVYGDENAGRLLCWPAGISGAASEIAEIDVAGETPSGYFGYGVDAPSDGVYAWDAAPPGRTVLADSSGTVEVPVQACGGTWTYCQDGYALGDTLITASDWGVIYAHDIETGVEVWMEDTLSTAWAPTNLDRWGARAVLFGAPFAGDGKKSRIYEEDGLLETDAAFVASVTSGDDTAGRGYIAYHRWDTREDGSGGSLYVFTERTGALRDSYGYPDLLGELVGIEDPADWAEPYVMLEDVGHDGLIAFAVRNGRYVGLLRVCGE